MPTVNTPGASKQLVPHVTEKIWNDTHKLIDRQPAEHREFYREVLGISEHPGDEWFKSAESRMAITSALLGGEHL